MRLTLLVFALGLLALCTQGRTVKKREKSKMLARILEAAVDKVQKLKARDYYSSYYDGDYYYSYGDGDDGGDGNGNDCSSSETSKRDQILSLIDRIVNGQSATQGEFPWMVALEHHDQLQCGASRISTNWALTAAHCFYDDNDNWVGHVADCSWKVKVNLVDLATGTPLAVSKIIKHPSYNVGTNIHDIALVKFQSTTSGPTIAIPSQDLHNELHSQICTVTGWGATGSGDSSNVLQKARVEFLSTCDEAEGTTNTVCAKGMDNMDSCSGDSGGPLTCEYQGQKVQVGVVSTGTGDGCGGGGIYTDVYKYKDWIDQEIST